MNSATDRPMYPSHISESIANRQRAAVKDILNDAQIDARLDRKSTALTAARIRYKPNDPPSSHDIARYLIRKDITEKYGFSHQNITVASKVQKTSSLRSPVSSGIGKNKNDWPVTVDSILLEARRATDKEYDSYDAATKSSLFGLDESKEDEQPLSEYATFFLENARNKVNPCIAVRKEIINGNDKRDELNASDRYTLSEEPHTSRIALDNIGNKVGGADEMIELDEESIIESLSKDHANAASGCFVSCMSDFDQWLINVEEKIAPSELHGLRQ
eukprot:CAMPEP_0194137572 /NCGR_PEP_ID=MMETSP0152-20130528/7466_1 /TAXON_ID=1049557 /ORGANISM="Thalassiothrix antarctica, Strain L6-D1" /LENGTH=273 /DNA_ID=CAMNT_0038834667 /DNA_START=41 /DNA_END=862 /DNA_ORIENTATION=-